MLRGELLFCARLPASCGLRKVGEKFVVFVQLWGLGWAGLVFGCIGLITNKNCCWWTSFFMFCLCMFIFWLLFGISSIIVLPFGDLCDGLPRTGEDATAWLLTFATTSGAIDTVNSELRNLYKDCLVQSPGYSGNLWSVVGVSEASVREQFASFNVTAMIPSDKIATNLDTTSNTLAFSNSKALMKSMTAGPPGLDTLKTQLEAVVTAAVSQPDVDAATALLADIATFNTETGALLAAVKSQVDVVEAGGKDSFAVLAFIPTANSAGTLEGYGFAKSTTDILITKGVNKYFYNENPPEPVKNQNITLSLSLVVRGGNVIVTTQVLEILRQHQQQMDQLGIHDPYGLVFVTPTTYGNVYDHLLGRVWHRSLQRCGLKPRRLYAQRHSFLSHALAMGNSPADLAAAAGHSTKMLLDTYAKPTGRLQMPTW